MQTATLNPRFLSRKQAAQYLGVITEATLAKLAVVGGGPKYYKLGRRVGYTTEDPSEFTPDGLGFAPRRPRA